MGGEDKDLDRDIALALGWETFLSNEEYPTVCWRIPGIDGAWGHKLAHWHLSPQWWWRPSERIAESMLVVDELRNVGFGFQLETLGSSWRVAVCREGESVAIVGDPSLPRAISTACLAVLTERKAK